MRLPLPLESYFPQSSARLVNIYVEQAPPEAKGPIQLIRPPGCTTLASPALGLGRGVYNFGERLYAVCGTTLISLDPTGSVSTYGTIPGSQRCFFADNGKDLGISADGVLYRLSGGVIDKPSTGRTVGMLTTLDSYVITNEPGSGRFASSALADLSNWPGLYFATAEGAPDNLVGLVADHRELFLAGVRTYELDWNAGGSAFPFTRSPSGFGEQGCLSGPTLAKLDNTIMWWADDFTVRRLTQGTPVRVSQFGVEGALRGYDYNGSYAFTFAWNGHLFYVLVVPNFGTWVFDATTGQWHERASYNQAWWQMVGSATCYGRVFLQDYITGAIGYLDATNIAEFGTPLRSEITTGQIYSDGNLITHQELEVRFRKIATQTGTSANPVIELQMSNDGGGSWLNLPSRSLGGIGAKPRVQWFRLGSSRERVYRFAFSDPLPFAIEDMLMSIQVGTS